MRVELRTKQITDVPSLTPESSWEKPAGFPSSEQPEPNPELKSQEESSSAPGDPSSLEPQVPEEPKEQSSTPKITFRVRVPATAGGKTPLLTASVPFYSLAFRKGKLRQSPQKRREMLRSVKMFLRMTSRRKRLSAHELSLSQNKM